MTYCKPTVLQRRVIRGNSPGGVAVQAVSEYTYDNSYTRGNLTEEKRWDSVKSAAVPGAGALDSTNSLVLTRACDSFGNLTDLLAPEVRTHFTYGSVGGQTGLYPTEIARAYQTPVRRMQSLVWDLSTGLLLGETDAAERR